jgi:uncharacterized membrane protein
MTLDPDQPALEARLDLLHGHVLELRSRVVALELELHARVAPAPAPVQRSWPAPSQPALIRPESIEASTHTSGELEDSRGPARLLAAAGGAAVLLGLALFVGFAIEQAWLAPGVRLVLAAIASALLTVAAWPIARRGYEAVAGAIGGAGLGGWFAAQLVARHTHELISSPQAFAALALGAGACLLIADRLRLRLMANLATVAACATPVLVAGGGAQLHELMVYQLLVVAGLLVLDARRRWPELPTIGLAATWLLAASWASEQLATGGGRSFVAWSVVLLSVSAMSAWRSFSAACEGAERTHANLRLLGAGIATWAASAASFGVDGSSFAAATALLALWHLGLAAALYRRTARRRGQDGAAVTITASAPFIALGWVQAIVVGPLMFEQAGPAWWWIAMSVIATVLGRLGRLRAVMIPIPALAALAWCVIAAQPWSLFVGLLAAVVLLAASVWPCADERPIPWLALLASSAWCVVTLALGPEATVARLAWCLVPVAALLGWTYARPTRHALEVATMQLGLALLGAIVALADANALNLDRAPNLGINIGLALLLLLLAGAGIAAVVRARGATQVEAVSITAPGLVIAGAVGLVVLLGVASLTGGAASLGQLGYSLGGAAVGLGLIVAGLRLHESVWRRAGLAVIGLAAAKLILVDLAAAAAVWRALSFVGLGAISIVGAFAYSRAARLAPAHRGEP